jgi:hypothetical protein
MSSLPNSIVFPFSGTSPGACLFLMNAAVRLFGSTFPSFVAGSLACEQISDADIDGGFLVPTATRPVFPDRFAAAREANERENVCRCRIPPTLPATARSQLLLVGFHF